MSDTQAKTNILAITANTQNAFFGVFSEDLELLYSDRLALDSCISSSDFVRSLKQSPTLVDHYKRVVVCLKSAEQMVLPYRDYNNTDIDTGWRHGLIEKPVDQEISIITRIDKYLHDALVTMYPTAKITSLGTQLAEHLYPSDKQVVAAHIDKGMVYMAVYDGMKCRILRAVAAETKEDYLYLLLHSLKVASIDPNTVSLKLSGDIYPDSLLYSLLKKHVRHVSFIAPARLTLRTKLPDTVKQRYFELYATAVCV